LDHIRKPFFQIVYSDPEDDDVPQLGYIDQMIAEAVYRKV